MHSHHCWLDQKRVLITFDHCDDHHNIYWASVHHLVQAYYPIPDIRSLLPTIFDIFQRSIDNRDNNLHIYVY